MAREFIEQAVLDDLAEQIAAVERDQVLLALTNFVPREQACRLLSDQIIARLDQLIDRADKDRGKSSVL